MGAEEQKKMLGNATPGQQRAALEMGVGFNNRNRRETRGQARQQKRDGYHDLDRLNHVVEKENEAHDFFGKGLTDWQKGVTGSNPSKDATNLKKQFDDYESSVLSTVPDGGKRHTALAESLPKIKDTFLKQGHQFAVDKLNERSRTVLDKGLQRIAKGALGATDEKGVQAHDDAAFDLINKYVLSEAKFDEKDADAMYDKYLGYAGVEKPKPVEVPTAGEAVGMATNDRRWRQRKKWRNPLLKCQRSPRRSMRGRWKKKLLMTEVAANWLAQTMTLIGKSPLELTGTRTRSPGRRMARWKSPGSISAALTGAWIRKKIIFRLERISATNSFMMRLKKVGPRFSLLMTTETRLPTKNIHPWQQTGKTRRKRSKDGLSLIIQKLEMWHRTASMSALSAASRQRCRLLQEKIKWLKMIGASVPAKRERSLSGDTSRNSWRPS